MRVWSPLMSNVTFNADGPPNIVLPDPPADLIAALTKASAQPQAHAAIAKVVRQFPEMPLVWATLGELVESQALDDQSKVEAYAYFRLVTTAASTPFDRMGGKDRATSGGPIPRTPGSFGASTDCGGWPRRLVRITSRSGAPTFSKCLTPDSAIPL